ncbi:MAG: hypothetical protein DLM53_06410 [Candidatus Eremiobacter antarcticus]|nr:serine/threonine-protein phosphatase [Candidatus Eremiobacteraeota bacterium]MBC5807140.1 serine/threonine-protein phosphatase [Candidatus Eremiobacteraeota bacterium]PZR62445.1 MAG: hypothetical protein DLM53_06410 [Candidatus Eremiobacter sp. RRmetagenome_bin22]
MKEELKEKRPLREELTGKYPPFIDQPPIRGVGGDYQPVSVHGEDRLEHQVSAAAAHMLVEHLFTPGTQEVPGVEYAVEYKLAQGRAGGDIVDVYQFDNESVAFSVADISGKGVQAAIHASMIKYGLRAYASIGLVAETVLRSLDRLYLENSAYEGSESFATVFFGHVDKKRRNMVYASAAHNSALIMDLGQAPRQLEVTAPLLGVFDDQQHLFNQMIIPLFADSILVVVTDGVTEARTEGYEFFGLARLASVMERERRQPMANLAHAIITEALAFAGGRAHDDMAVLAVRFTGREPSA